MRSAVAGLYPRLSSALTSAPLPDRGTAGGGLEQWQRAARRRVGGIATHGVSEAETQRLAAGRRETNRGELAETRAPELLSFFQGDEGLGRGPMGLPVFFIARAR